MTITVAVADDQALVRAGFVALLSSIPDFQVAGEATQGEEAIRLVRATHPDVVLMDVRMPILNGIDATHQISTDAECASTKVVILTTFGLDEYVFGALRAGAVGFLLKDIPPDELIRAVRVAAAGDALLAPSITRRLIEAFAAAPPPTAPRSLPELTEREKDILTLVARGMSNHDIARTLHIGYATVKTYVSRLLAKLGGTARVHLVIHAYETGLVNPEGPPDSAQQP